MQEALREHAERLAAQRKPAWQASVDVNSGEVVMRTVETGGWVEYTPVGHVATLAARMPAVAPTGGIVISEDCTVWSRATSNCVRWGRRNLGVSAIECVRGDRARAATDPLPAIGAARANEFVGRDREGAGTNV